MQTATRISFFREGQKISLSLEEITKREHDLFFVTSIPFASDMKLGRAESVSLKGISAEGEKSFVLSYTPYKLYRTKQLNFESREISLQNNNGEISLPVGYYLFK